MGTGPQRQDDLGPCSLQNWAQLSLPFNVIWAAEPSWKLWLTGFQLWSISYGLRRGRLRDTINFCFKTSGGIIFAGVSARKMTSTVTRTSCCFLFKGKSLCLCAFLKIFPSWSLFVKGLEYCRRGSDGEREFLAMHPSFPAAGKGHSTESWSVRVTLFCTHPLKLFSDHFYLACTLQHCISSHLLSNWWGMGIFLY